MTKNWKKYSLKKLSFFWKKIAIYFSLGLLKGRPSCRRILQPPKENILRFKKWNYELFSIIVDHFCSLLDPDPDSGIPLNPDPTRIRIHKTLQEKNPWKYTTVFGKQKDPNGRSIALGEKISK
jgi:hypothetical protein